MCPKFIDSILGWVIVYFWHFGVISVGGCVVPLLLQYCSSSCFSQRMGAVQGNQQVYTFR
jgi:hypothetical protein